MNKSKKAFTLLELLISIAILGVLAAFVSGNFINSLKKGRDTRRKEDIEQVQKALELYYGDNGRYPLTSEVTLNGTTPLSKSGRTYMQKLPADPLKPQGYEYRYCVDSVTQPTQYQIYTLLENTDDPKIIATPSYLANCSITECKSGKGCNYGISSQNINP